MTIQNNTKLIHRILSAFNVPIAPGTTDYLHSTLTSHGLYAPKDIEEAVEGIMSSLFIEQSQVDEISRQVLEPIIHKLAQDASVDQSNKLAVMSEHLFHVKDVPRLTYNRHQHQFLPYATQSKLMGNAQDKTLMFRDRFDIIKQAIVRAQLYVHQSNKLQLTPIKNLLGCEGQEFTLLGMLSCLKQGEVYLEDLDGSVRLYLDAEEMEVGVGFFTETSIVLVQGIYFGSSGFKVTSIHHPPVEGRLESLQAHKRLDMFGGPVPMSHPNTLKSLVQKEDPAGTVLVLSDFWLDYAGVIDQFDKILTGVESTLQYASQNGDAASDNYDVPVCIVLMGNFCSPDAAHKVDYKSLWTELWQVISKYQMICQYTHFVFVPGPNDPWAPGLLPQPPLPQSQLSLPRKSPLRKELLHFATNPCRVRFGAPTSSGYDTAALMPYSASVKVLSGEESLLTNVVGREMIFYRADIASKVSRNVVLKPNIELEQNLNVHLVTTMLSQYHLSPLNLVITPTVWAHDHQLRIYPLPDLLILGDRTEHYHFVASQCAVSNPGSFATNGFGMMMYRFSNSQIERVTM